MTNYTSNTYQMKREILNFSKKISEGCSKPVTKFVSDMIYGMFSRKSVVLTEIARGLKENIELHNTVDRLSNNLMNLDEEQKQIIINNYYDEVLNCLNEINDDYVIVLNDDSDLNHEYSQKLEDICVVKDASSRTDKYVNGYKVCEYAALSPNKKSPMSLYSKIYSTISEDFKSENDETIKGEEFVNAKLKKIKKKPIHVRDRGFDANEFFVRNIKNDIKFITRLKKSRNLIYNEKNVNVLEIANKKKGKIKTKLIYKGENKECYISYTKVKLPAYPNKEIYLVTVHGLKDDIDEDNEKYGEDNVLMFLTNLEIKNKDEAERIVKIYFLRWRIEEYFKSKKQNYKWEDSIVRTINSMNNLNMFLTMVMLKLTLLIEKMDKNLLIKIILEQAMALKKKCIVWFGQMSQGVYEILKYAHTGVRDWYNIRYVEKYKQLELKL